jgi:hypothetical protein
MSRAASVLALLAAAPLGGADWPRCRGPNGSGVAEGWPPPASLAPERALWKVGVRAGERGAGARPAVIAIG